MSTARTGQTATLLLDGRVLVAGGGTPGSSSPLATAELYDPLTGAFTAAATMTVPRAGTYGHTLTGRQGVSNRWFTDSALSFGTDTAEIYDPAKACFWPRTSQWSWGAWPIRRRCFQTARSTHRRGGSLVAEAYSPSDGLVLGYRDRRIRPSAELTATLLKNGSVLIVGGFDYGKGFDDRRVVSMSRSLTYRELSSSGQAARIAG